MPRGESHTHRRGRIKNERRRRQGRGASGAPTVASPRYPHASRLWLAHVTRKRGGGGGKGDEGPPPRDSFGCCGAYNLSL